MKLEHGDIVIAIMHTPREKLLGILEDISTAGVAMRAIDLSYFDDWCQSIAADEPFLPMTDYFLPMWRVERISRDDAGGNMASMAEQFETRTGKKLENQ